MNFLKSSHHQQWMFDSFSQLEECRQRAVLGSKRDGVKPCHFAAGFRHGRPWSTGEANANPIRSTATSSMISDHKLSYSNEPASQLALTSANQNLLVKFYGHQIHLLVGSDAIFRDLREITTRTRSTAVILFRRFYLSNSILDHDPYLVAGACTFLACKTESEVVHIDFIVLAVREVMLKFGRSTFEYVTAPQVALYERRVMQGVDYSFHCHHAEDVLGDFDVDKRVQRRAHLILQKATLFDDAVFLVHPCTLAAAALLLAKDTVHDQGDVWYSRTRESILGRLCVRCDKEEEWEPRLRETLGAWLSSPWMELGLSPSEIQAATTQRAKDIHRVLHIMSQQSRKRKRDCRLVPLGRTSSEEGSSAARVTPTGVQDLCR